MTTTVGATPTNESGQSANPRTFGKVRRAWRDGTFLTKAARRTRNSVYLPIHTVVEAARLPKADRRIDFERGFVDHRGTDVERTCSDSALRRIVAAFNASDGDVSGADADFEVRGVWSEMLALKYGGLRRILRSEDIVELRRLLENVHREPMSRGVGGTRDDTGGLPGILGRNYARVLWCQWRNILRTANPPWSVIASPMAGNPSGPWVEGRLLFLDTLRHAYYAARVLNRINSQDRVEVLEIGGGLAGQAVQFTEIGASRIAGYTIIDLPEVAALSAYVLMSTYGESHVRLFGEPRDSVARFEILPPWTISELQPKRFGLVFNSYSFSEMDGRTSGRYLREIERLRPRWFLHVNIDRRFTYRQVHGGVSVNRIGSEMAPSSELYEFVEARRAPFVRPENRSNKATEYVYRLREDGPAAGS